VARQFDNLIFDLDGTLVDSLPGIEASAGWAISQCLPHRELPSMREVIGPPIATMFAQTFPDLSREQQAHLVAAFRQHYDQEGCLLSTAYPGVAEVLQKLKVAGVKMFVLTNKPALASEKILAHLRLLSHFTRVISPDSTEPPFAKKAAGGQYLANAFNLMPKATALIGDGIDDREAASACGFAFFVASYGYGSAAGQNNGRGAQVLKTFSHILPLML
jgi:phosphoglycolate phosphatase